MYFKKFIREEFMLVNVILTKKYHHVWIFSSNSFQQRSIESFRLVVRSTGWSKIWYYFHFITPFFHEIFKELTEIWPFFKIFINQVFQYFQPLSNHWYRCKCQIFRNIQNFFGCYNSFFLLYLAPFYHFFNCYFQI